MPKIIEDIEKIIVNEAKRQLFINGYSGMTLRSVASGCGIAVGTIYNYYKSKDDLIALFMLEDWKNTLKKMKADCAVAILPVDVFGCVYRGIVEYSDKYAALFSDAEAIKSSNGIFLARHSLLRSQIVLLITDTCREYALHYTDYLPVFIAEAILSHASERKDYSVLSEILVQLFKEPSSCSVPE